LYILDHIRLSGGYESFPCRPDEVRMLAVVPRHGAIPLTRRRRSNSVELVTVLFHKLDSVRLMEFEWIVRLSFDIYSNHIESSSTVAFTGSTSFAVKV